MDKVTRFKEITQGMSDLYALKNRNYSDSFSAMYEEFGIMSSVIRLTDKYLRFKTLAKLPPAERQEADESIKDTLKDMACYAIMTIMSMEEAEMREMNEA
jgi:hypothetical protein